MSFLDSLPLSPLPSPSQQSHDFDAFTGGDVMRWLFESSNFDLRLRLIRKLRVNTGYSIRLWGIHGNFEASSLPYFSVVDVVKIMPRSTNLSLFLRRGSYRVTLILVPD
jgi:hypothetical protein